MKHSEDDNEPIDSYRPEHLTAENAFSEAIDTEHECEIGADGSLGRAAPERRHWQS